MSVVAPRAGAHAAGAEDEVHQPQDHAAHHEDVHAAHQGPRPQQQICKGLLRVRRQIRHAHRTTGAHAEEN